MLAKSWAVTADIASAREQMTANISLRPPKNNSSSPILPSLIHHYLNSLISTAGDLTHQPYHTIKQYYHHRHQPSLSPL
jgi:hypothetical protein